MRALRLSSPFVSGNVSAALVLVLALGANPVLAQTRLAQSNLVPPGVIAAPGPAAQLAQSNPAVIAETNMRIERLEGELRSITGQMEQLMFQMRQMQDELTRAREDSEFRLRELEGNGTPGGGLPMDSGGLDLSDEELRRALLAREQGAPARDLGTLSVNGAGQPVGATLGVAGGLNGANGPLDLSRLTLNGEPETRPQQSLGATPVSVDPLAELSASDVYELGYDHVLRGDYGQAVSTFGDFLGRYDDDPLRPNAHFWLGESHFALGQYTPAAEQFLTVFNRYPEDVKVPDALLKLAMSLERLGAQEQACATFNKLLTDYPRAPQIVLDTAVTEQSLAGC